MRSCFSWLHVYGLLASCAETEHHAVSHIVIGACYEGLQRYSKGTAAGFARLDQQGDDYNFHRTVSSFRKQMKMLGDRILSRFELPLFVLFFLLSLRLAHSLHHALPGSRARMEACLERDPAHSKYIKDESMDDHDRMAVITDVCAAMYERVVS